MNEKIHWVDHPLIQHKLTLMRRKDQSTAGFRQLLREISTLLAYEVTRDLPLTNIDIEKALRAQGITIDRRKIMLREPIKQLGTFPLPVRLGGGLEAQIKVTIEREVSE